MVQWFHPSNSSSLTSPNSRPHLMLLEQITCMVQLPASIALYAVPLPDHEVFLKPHHHHESGSFLGILEIDCASYIKTLIWKLIQRFIQCLLCTKYCARCENKNFDMVPPQAALCRCIFKFSSFQLSLPCIVSSRTVAVLNYFYILSTTQCLHRVGVKYTN